MSQPLTLTELQHLATQIDPEFTRCNNRLSLAHTGGFSEHRFGQATAFQDARKPGSTIEDQVLPVVEEHYCRLPFEFYIASIGGKAVASASAFFCDGVAWFNNAVTDIDYRGRGCHAALLGERIASAKRKNCSLIISDTEFGSISHRNMARSGFELGFTTAEFRNPVSPIDEV